MTDKEFYRKIVNGKADLLQIFLDTLQKNKVKFCIIGGLAVNAYAEPVVSLDLDVVIDCAKTNGLLSRLKKDNKGSKLRIQIQTDERYQGFLKRAKVKNVLGYKIPVATIEDVLQGKIWVAMDEMRRPSKRQKDLADILRLVEGKAALKELLPEELRKQLKLG